MYIMVECPHDHHHTELSPELAAEVRAFEDLISSLVADLETRAAEEDASLVSQVISHVSSRQV